jgi:hypothetical protein
VSVLAPVGRQSVGDLGVLFVYRAPPPCRPPGLPADRIALPPETTNAASRQASAARPHHQHIGTPPCYNERKKFNRACWSADDRISKLEITVLASEPALA